MAKRWYVLHTYSGYENKVMNDLEHRVEAYGLQDAVVDVQAPGEMVTEVKKRGEKDVTSTKEVKFYPGYVLVRMELDDNTWSVVRNTPGVTGFLGVDGKPSPLRREEFNKMMRRSGGKADATTLSALLLMLKSDSRYMFFPDRLQTLTVSCLRSMLSLARLRSCSPSLAAKLRLS